MALKGHGFSRAVKAIKIGGALAPEGMLIPLHHQENSSKALYGFQTNVATDSAGRMVAIVFPWNPIRKAWLVVAAFNV